MPSKSKPSKGSAGSSRKQSVDETKKIKAAKKVVVPSSSDSDSDSSVEQKGPAKRQARSRSASNISVDKKASKHAAPSKVVPPKKKVQSSSSSDSSDSDEPKKAAPTKGKAQPAKKVIESDSSDSSSEAEVVVLKGTKAGWWSASAPTLIYVQAVAEGSTFSIENKKPLNSYIRECIIQHCL